MLWILQIRIRITDIIASKLLFPCNFFQKKMATFIAKAPGLFLRATGPRLATFLRYAKVKLMSLVTLTLLEHKIEKLLSYIFTFCVRSLILITFSTRIVLSLNPQRYLYSPYSVTDFYWVQGSVLWKKSSSSSPGGGCQLNSFGGKI
jgi:hypothetical protein